MNFLNSTILAGLVAALAPLIIHLLNRQKVRTVQFSSLRFLRDLQKTKMRRLKLRQALLLIIRTLIVVFLVLAFARPTIKGDAFSALGAHARTTAVILMDRSASMQARTADGSAAERASRKAAQVITLFREGDQAVRGTFDQTAQFSSATSDFARLAEELHEETPGAGGTDLIAAIAGAERAAAQSKNLNREIYVFSDLARGGLTASAALPPPDGANASHIYLLDVGDRRVVNTSVTAIQLAGQLIEPGVPFELTATVVNRSAETFDHVLASVFLDGRRLAQSDLALLPHGTGEVQFRIQTDSTGMHQGYVELADDDNPADNRCFFAFRIPGKTRVLLASDFPSERAFLRRALMPGGQGRLAVTERDTRDLVRENLAEYDAVVLAAVRKLEPLLVENLDRYLRSGGGVLAIPSGNIDTASYNAGLFRRWCGIGLVERPVEFPSTEQYFVLQDIDWQHPVLAVYREVPREKIPEIRFYSRFRLAGDGRPRALARFSDGQAAWAEAAVGRGRLFVWTAPLDPAYSDISFHSLFVPLVNRSIEYLAADLGEQAADYRVGQPVTRPRDLFWRGPLVLRFPDGRTEILAVEISREADKYATPALSEPGGYLVLDGENPVDVFAVNIDAAETDVQPADPPEIESRLPGRRITILKSDDDPTSVVLAARYGREIFKPLLWAAVTLLFAEMLLARTKKSELPPDMTG